MKHLNISLLCSGIIKWDENPTNKLIQSSVYSSDVRYLGFGPFPYVARIGIRLRSFLPDVKPRYRTSEVLNTANWRRQNLPKDFRGIEDTCGVYVRFRAQKKTKIISGFSTCQVFVHFFVNLGLIRAIVESDPCIPRIELAWHTSSEVSTVDLYSIEKKECELSHIITSPCKMHFNTHHMKHDE